MGDAAEQLEMWRETVWLTGYDWRADSPYLHVVRGPDDPERQDRARSLGGSTADVKRGGLRALRKRPAEELADEIRAALEAGPSTFNAIAVRLWDTTADMLLGEAPDDALWSLVVAGEVEHTEDARPVLFRLRGRHG